MKKIPFSRKYGKKVIIFEEDEWIYLPKDPPSIFSCGARISCSVRAVELCARSDIPSDCPISKQTGGGKPIYIQRLPVSRHSYVSLIKYFTEDNRIKFLFPYATRIHSERENNSRWKVKRKKVKFKNES